MAWPPATHQDVTDAINATVKVTGDQSIAGAKTFSGNFGVRATPTDRQPFTSIQVLNGASMAGTTDVVGHALNTVVSGNYSGITGSNPGYVWGVNMFTKTGSAAGDANGVTTLMGGLIEANVAAPAGSTIGTVIGAMAEASFFGAAAGATVASMTSLRVGAPKRKDGATAGTVSGTAYGLFIETVTAADTGAATGQSLCVSGGTSWFGGPITVNNANVNIGSGTLTARSALLGRTDKPVAGRITAYGDTAGNDLFTIRGFTGQTTDLFRVQRTTDDTNWTSVFGILETGTLRVNNTATVPAANNTSGGYLYAEGGALKWRGSAGTVTQLAAA